MRQSESLDKRTIAGYRAVVIGGSAGAFDGMLKILGGLPKDYRLVVLIVQHLHPNDDGGFAQCLRQETELQVIEPCDKEEIRAGCAYSAPANYHMLIEHDGSISLSIDERVNWSRPSIDVLFESAARMWGKGLVAVLLSGASADGAGGIQAVRKRGGWTIVQNPAEAECQIMPRSAIETGAVDNILRIEEIAALFRNADKKGAKYKNT